VSRSNRAVTVSCPPLIRTVAGGGEKPITSRDASPCKDKEVTLSKSPIIGTLEGHAGRTLPFSPKEGVGGYRMDESREALPASGTQDRFVCCCCCCCCVCIFLGEQARGFLTGDRDVASLWLLSVVDLFSLPGKGDVTGIISEWTRLVDRRRPRIFCDSCWSSLDAPSSAFGLAMGGRFGSCDNTSHLGEFMLMVLSDMKIM
jgi:hypothetical protein